MYTTEKFHRNQPIRNNPVVVLGAGKSRQTYPILGVKRADERVKEVIKESLAKDVA